MEINVFRRLERLLNEDPFTSGLFLDYQNNNGERRQFNVINITPSPYYGCFEADCFSDYQFEIIDDIIGSQDSDLATTSHRTFKIENIISARPFEV